jgi:hypothetical protein
MSSSLKFDRRCDEMLKKYKTARSLVSKQPLGPKRKKLESELESLYACYQKFRDTGHVLNGWTGGKFKRRKSAKLNTRSKVKDYIADLHRYYKQVRRHLKYSSLMFEDLMGIFSDLYVVPRESYRSYYRTLRLEPIKLLEVLPIYPLEYVNYHERLKENYGAYIKETVVYPSKAWRGLRTRDFTYDQWVEVLSDLEFITVQSYIYYILHLLQVMLFRDFLMYWEENENYSIMSIDVRYESEEKYPAEYAVKLEKGDVRENVPASKVHIKSFSFRTGFLEYLKVHKAYAVLSRRGQVMEYPYIIRAIRPRRTEMLPRRKIRLFEYMPLGVSGFPKSKDHYTFDLEFFRDFYYRVGYLRVGTPFRFNADLLFKDGILDTYGLGQWKGFEKSFFRSKGICLKMSRDYRGNTSPWIQKEYTADPEEKRVLKSVTLKSDCHTIKFFNLGSDKVKEVTIPSVALTFNEPKETILKNFVVPESYVREALKHL